MGISEGEGERDEGRGVVAASLAGWQFGGPAWVPVQDHHAGFTRLWRNKDQVHQGCHGYMDKVEKYNRI